MEKIKLIPVDEFCRHHHITVNFIEELADFGLVETTFVKKAAFIHPGALPDVEKLIRLHQDLEINPEGLHAVLQLLNKMETLQHEIRTLEQKLHYLERINN